MRLSRGVSNEIDVGTITTDVMTILWIKATTTLLFQSSLTNLVCTFRVFFLLMNLRVHTESWILAQQFSRPRKSLESRDQVWKNCKETWVFFQSCNKLALFNLAHTFVFLRFLRSLLITYLITLSLEKKWLFWKKSGKSLEFCIPKSVQTLKPVAYFIFYFLCHHCGFLSSLVALPCKTIMIWGN